MKDIAIFIDESGEFESLHDQKQRNPLIAGFLFEKGAWELSDVGITAQLIEIVAPARWHSFSVLHATSLRNSAPNTFDAIVDILPALPDIQIFFMEYPTRAAGQEFDKARYVRMLYNLFSSLLLYTGLVDEETRQVEIWVAERSNFQVNHDGIKGMAIAAQEGLNATFPNLEIVSKVVNIDQANENRLRLADVISHILFIRQEERQYYEKIKAQVIYDFQYTEIHNSFVKLAQLFFNQEYAQAIITYWEKKSAFPSKSYYARRLKALYDEAIQTIGKWEYQDIQIRQIFQYVEKQLRTSQDAESRNLEAIKSILFVINTLLKDMPRCDPTLVLWFQFKVCQNFLRYADHLSDYRLWQEYGEKGSILAAQLRPYAIYYQDIVDFENVYANGLANFYRFDEAITKLHETLENVKMVMNVIAQISKIPEAEIKNYHLGKVFGSLGQNYAFQADVAFKEGQLDLANASYSKARECFEKALNHFTSSKDKSVQYSYLGHLALSQGKIEEAFTWIQKMAGTEIYSGSFNQNCAWRS